MWCDEVTQTPAVPVARLPKLWRCYSAPLAVSRLSKPVSRLLWRSYLVARLSVAKQLLLIPKKYFLCKKNGLIKLHAKLKDVQQPL